MKRLFIGAASAAVMMMGLATAPSHAQEPIIGEMRIMPYQFCPRGWAEANGSLIAISSNSALFSLYGTVYGGDGVNTFALPDMRGRIANDHGQGNGLSFRPLGAKFGAETVTLTISEIPTHTHDLRGTSDAPNSRSLSNASWGDFGATFNAYNQGGPLNESARFDAMTTSGGNLAHQNIQPVLVLRHCVAMYGIYPSRN